MRNYYELLGVHRESTPEELKEARRAKAREVHPDYGHDGEMMALLNTAYETLTHERKRNVYHIELASRGYQCGRCEGKGSYYRQKGFTARVTTRCSECHGAGVVLRPM